MPKYCINSITIDTSKEEDPQYVLKCFESIFGEDWLRRDAQLQMSIRVFAAGIIGIFHIDEEPPFELTGGLGFTLTTYKDPIATHFSKWLKNVHEGNESIVRCMMLHRELLRSLPEWGMLTVKQKSDFKTLLSHKGEDWGIKKDENISDRDFYNQFFHDEFKKTIRSNLQPMASVRAFKPTDILKEINGETGGLIRNYETAHEYHVKAFETPTTDFICFCTKDTFDLKEYIFETIDAPPISAFMEFCKKFPKTVITIVSLMKKGSTCIRFKLKNKQRLITIDKVTAVTENLSGMGLIPTSDSEGTEEVLLRCPKWVYDTSLVNIA